MKKIAKCFLILFLLVVLIILSAGIYVIVTIRQISNPDIINLDNLNLYNNQYEIYDSENKHISTNSIAGQKTIEIESVPDFVPQAFVSIEDKTFYQHSGLNYGRIIKAGVTNLLSGYAKEGASTITQQLIKNIYLTNEKTLSRKIQEAYLALKLEQGYPKEKILETYLNAIYFGNGSFGIESAAQNYFGKSAASLTLPEAATLAGIIKSPKTYSPIFNPQNCLERRNLVLKNMLDDKVITEPEYLAATQAELKTSDNLNNFDDYIQEILRETSSILNKSERDVSCSGYKIYTNINSKLQDKIAKLKSETKENAALVIDNEKGKIIATFGNISERRQPASTIKPFVCYAPNFETGNLSPATPINDDATNFGGYSPRNANGKYIGWTDVRTALSQSLNIPAVKALSYVDLDYAINYAKKCGFELQNSDKNLAVALGATQTGTKIKEVASAYSLLANLGCKKSINLINKITDHTGKTVFLAQNSSENVMSQETAYMINDVLKNCVSDGTAKKLNTLNMSNLAAKTGTFGANDGTNTDAWCVSFTPKFTVLSWYGNTSGKAENNLSKTENGGTISARQSVKIWESLTSICDDKRDFACPTNVSTYSLDTLSLGQQKLELANELTPERYKKSDLFNTKFAPVKVSNNFKIATIPILNLTKNQGKLTLDWEAEEIYNYHLYAKTKNSQNLLSIISGSDKKLNFVLDIPTETTEYYLLVKSKFSDNVSEQTESKTYYVSISNLGETKGKFGFWKRKTE